MLYDYKYFTLKHNFTLLLIALGDELLYKTLQVTKLHTDLTDCC